MEQGKFEGLCTKAGFESKSDLRIMNGHKFWKEPNGDAYHLKDLPPQDMGTLFNWIWPKLTVSQREDVLNANYFVLIHDGDSDYICEELLTTIYEVTRTA